MARKLLTCCGGCLAEAGGTEVLWIGSATRLNPVIDRCAATERSNSFRFATRVWGPRRVAEAYQHRQSRWAVCGNGGTRRRSNLFTA